MHSTTTLYKNNDRNTHCQGFKPFINTLEPSKSSILAEDLTN